MRTPRLLELHPVMNNTIRRSRPIGNCEFPGCLETDLIGRTQISELVDLRENGRRGLLKGRTMLLILIILLLIFAFGGYRMGPGLGYYGMGASA
jgi:hypothetical protein